MRFYTTKPSWCGFKHGDEIKEKRFAWIPTKLLHGDMAIWLFLESYIVYKRYIQAVKDKPGFWHEYDWEFVHKN